VPALYCPRGRHIDDFVENTQNTNKKQFLARDYGTKQSLVVYENFIPQKGPSTQLINAKKLHKMCDATIGAEELADISSYQTLSVDKKKKKL
jgi:hypothetical protein